MTDLKYLKVAFVVQLWVTPQIWAFLRMRFWKNKNPFAIAKFHQAINGQIL